MAEAASTVWQLDKYARYVLLKEGSSTGQWNHYDNSGDSRLAMTLTNTNHLIVLQGSLVLESHSLTTARAWMRGMCKNDSLLFLYKFKKGTRRFKVKFASDGDRTASQVCSDAAVTLSKLFSVQITKQQSAAPTPQLDHHQNQEKTCAAADTDTNATPTPLEGDVSLGIMAQILLGESQDKLPETYKTSQEQDTRLAPVSDDVMLSHLRVFLADPTFPAFVEEVDKELQKIIKECKD